MKTKNKITYTVTNPDSETTNWIGGQIAKAHIKELQNALSKAVKALEDGRTKTIRTKAVKIEIEALP